MEHEKKLDGDEEYVPLVIWGGAASAGEVRLPWRYVWMNFVSMILLFAAVTMAYRMGAQNCR